MTHKVKFTHSDKSRAHINRVLEFEGESGKFREAFWPEEVVKVG